MPDFSWLDKCLTRSYVSQHYEDWDSRIFKRYDIREFIRTLDETGADLLLVTARTHNGMWFCDIGWGKQHLGLKGVDQLQECVRFFHERGKKVAAYVSSVYDEEMYNEHPDWRQVTFDKVPVAGGDDKSWGKVVCLNSPYREYFMQMIRDLVKTHELDAVFFDMPFFENEPCYCEYCQRSFYSKFGTFMPKKDWLNPAFDYVRKFRNESNASFIQEICAAVKLADPRVAVGIQHRMMLCSNGAMTGQTIKAAKAADYLYFDPYVDMGFLKAGVCTRLAGTVSGHVPEVSIVGRPGYHLDYPSMKPLDHLRMDAFTTIANGGAVQLFDVMAVDGTLQKSMWERFRRIFDEVHAREPWLGGIPDGSVLLYYSENTRYWYGKDKPEDRYDNCFFGWCRALTEEHVPFLPVAELTAERLAGSRVLVLPNAACLGAQELKLIRDFVAAGGGLVCSQKTSLYDPDAKFLGDYGLGEVLGIRYAGDTSSYDRLYYRFHRDLPFTGRVPEDGLVNSWGFMQKTIPLPDAVPAANLVYPLVRESGKRFVNIMVNTPAVDSPYSVCVANCFGKGKTVYFAGSIGANYARLSQSEMKWLMADAVRSVSAEALPYGLQAPNCVEMTVYDQPEKNRTVVHLVNYQPENGRTIAYDAVETRHIIQEILPVYGLMLTVRCGKAVRSVRLEPQGLALQPERENGALRITVPELRDHTMVVLEYENT